MGSIRHASEYTTGSELFTPVVNSRGTLRNGWSVKAAGHLLDVDFRRFSDRIAPRFATWAQLEAVDPLRTRATLVDSLGRLCGSSGANHTRALKGVDLWTPRAFEDALGRHRGTGRQSLAAVCAAIAKLTLADPLLTAIDLFEAQQRLEPPGGLEPMNERELELRIAVQRGRVDRERLHPLAPR